MYLTFKVTRQHLRCDGCPVQRALEEIGLDRVSVFSYTTCYSHNRSIFRAENTAKLVRYLDAYDSGRCMLPTKFRLNFKQTN